VKRFLIPLLAAVALPTAANAESTWLVIRYVSGAMAYRNTSMEKIEMRDMTQCQEEGAKWVAAPRMEFEKKNYNYSRFGFICLTGK